MILTPTVLDAIVKKVNEQEITNSKEIRKLRQILKDPIGKEHFLGSGGTIDTALRTLGPAPSKKTHGLLGNMNRFQNRCDVIRGRPWPR